MPGYQGGKCLGAEFIIKVLNDERYRDRPYVEPFCGMCNILMRVRDKSEYLASDKSALLIHLHKSLRNGEALPTITRERYKELRSRAQINTETATACFAYSFNSIPWGGYVNQYTRRNGRVDDIPASRKRAYINLSKNEQFKKTEFKCCDYCEISLPPKSIIYCDPPYNGTKSYNGVSFDTDAFFQTVREWTRDGHVVFISEYDAPVDFTCIAESPKQVSLSGGDKQRTKTERLFVHQSHFKPEAAHEACRS